MKLRYFSDVHLEFIDSIDDVINLINPGVDEVCILAGDIGNPYQQSYDIFMTYMNNNFKKTFVIAGNHEYYNKHKSIQETNDYMYSYFQKFDNISFLNNTYELYEGYCFIGTTLWSKITNPKYKINDVKYIPHFDYLRCNQLNMLCVDFLEDVIQNNDNCIIITHHVPSNSLIDIKYKTHDMSPYNQWFCCNMDDMIESNKNKITCWFYGHTHTALNTVIHDVPFLCNPIGYPNENKNITFTVIHNL